MDHTVIQYQLRKNMNCDESYDYIKMWGVYLRFMCETDEFKELPLIKYKTFKNLINSWVKTPDGWLIKEGRGVEARFYKRKNYIWRCHMSQNKLIAKVADKLRKMRWKL